MSDTPQILWEGILEKKGMEFFSRWNRRKAIVFGDECRYFDADSDNSNIRGIIKLVPESVVSSSGSHVLIKTVGRPDKRKGDILSY